MPIETLNKLPKKAKEMWEEVYATAKSKYGEKRGARIAWAAIKKKFKKEGDRWVARSLYTEDTTTIKYVFMADEASVSKGQDGYSYVDYVLSSNSVDGHGTKFDDFALTNMVDQINNEGLVGALDVNVHEEWNRLKALGYSPEEIEALLQGRDTGIKAINARMDKNKVVARLQVKNDLMNEVMKYKGASVEARVPLYAVVGNTFKQARLQGFVLTNFPSNPDAVRV